MPILILSEKFKMAALSNSGIAVFPVYPDFVQVGQTFLSDNKRIIITIPINSREENMSLTDKEKIVAIMKETCLHTYLATCDRDQPRVRPVSPIVEDDTSIWVTTFSTSRKVKQIKENPKICLTFVEQPGGDKAAFVIGEAEIVSDIEEKKRVWKLATFDLAEYFPEGPESKDFCLLKIIVKKIEWRDSWTTNKIYEPT